jgi:hypothetical protein
MKCSECLFETFSTYSVKALIGAESSFQFLKFSCLSQAKQELDNKMKENDKVSSDFLIDII